SSATFSFTPGSAGRHVVRMAYSAHPTRARNVPVRIIQGTRTLDIVVDQTEPHPAGEAFRTVGEVELKAGETVTIEVSNRGTQGFVILDALQFESR
ncbi:MAG: xanthan lyase, partial [Verrucomicrobiota bacterium]